MSRIDRAPSDSPAVDSASASPTSHPVNEDRANYDTSSSPVAGIPNLPAADAPPLQPNGRSRFAIMVALSLLGFAFLYGVFDPLTTAEAPLWAERGATFILVLRPGCEEEDEMDLLRQIASRFGLFSTLGSSSG